MKKFLVAMLLVASQFAGATSIRNVRLQYTTKPIGPLAIRSNGVEKTIVVYLGGEVAQISCPKGTRFGKCTSKKVALLNVRQMDRIERDIQEAREGEILPPPPIHCLAITTRTVDYSADNQ